MLTYTIHHFFCNHTLSLLQPISIINIKKELEVCDQESSDGSESIIYKQVGPVLIKNDLDEAKETVGKRLEFIEGEM